MSKMIEDAIKAITESSERSSVYIGADSIVYKKKDKWFAKYSTVIILHMDSKHGGKIFHESVDLPEYGNLRQRLMNEVTFAIAAATGVIDHIGNRKLEIHLDINSDEDYASNMVVKEAIGYVRGTLNIEPRIKPEAWASTHCADHAVRHWG
jgi:predicted RNase H-related nuclease YkuK (DUF458 family)